MKHTKITTDRLSLSTLDLQDCSFIQELVNTKGWLQFIGDRKIHSKKDAVAYIDKINATSDLCYWVVRLKETQDSIGVITFMKRAYLEHFDIGFAFLPQYNNSGYAYEAAKSVLAFAHLQPEHTTILATTKPDNERSIKLLEKLGLQFDKTITVESEELQVYSTAV